MDYRSFGMRCAVGSAISLLLAGSAFGMSATEQFAYRELDTAAQAFASTFTQEKDAHVQWQMLKNFGAAVDALDKTLPAKSEAFVDQCIKTILVPLSQRIVGAFLDMHKNLDQAFFADKSEASLSITAAMVIIGASNPDLFDTEIQKKNPPRFVRGLRSLVQKITLYTHLCKRLNIDMIDFKTLVLDTCQQFFGQAFGFDDPEEHERLMQEIEALKGSL